MKIIKCLPVFSAELISRIAHGCLLLGSLASVRAELNPGQPAPPIRLAELWQAPQDTDLSWDALRGRVVVLDFWATWCGPCTQGIPDLNALARDCQDLPVTIVAVTDESPAPARAFLKKNPLATWVGIDAQGATFNAYQVQARPQAVVVDKHGRIAAVVRPHALNRSFLQAVIEDRTDRVYEPVLHVDIRRHAGVTSARSLEWIPGGIKFANASIPQILNLISPRSDGRVDSHDPLPSGDYDVEVAAGGSDESAWRAVLKIGVEKTFGVILQETERVHDVYLLRTIPGTVPRLQAPEDRDQCTGHPNGFDATSTTMTSLAGNLGVRISRPVIDETGWTDRFKISIHWDSWAPEDIIRAVREQIGLDLIPARRSLPILMVTSAQARR